MPRPLLVRADVELVQHDRGTLVDGDGECHAGDRLAVVGDEEFRVGRVKPALSAAANAIRR